MPIDPATLERKWPRTAAALRRFGCVWQAPDPSGWDRSGPHKPRREAIFKMGAEMDPAATPFLVATVLQDSSRDVRAAALAALDRLPGDAVDAALAIGLADSRSGMVRRRAQNLIVDRGPAGFFVLMALFEDRPDRIDTTDLLAPLGSIAERHPRIEMRAALPRLEKEARRFFQAPGRKRALQETIRRIEAATETLKSLPLAAAPAVTSGTLPVPAAAPETGAAPSPALPWWRRWWRRWTG